jgi:hypothetical protein
MYKNSIQNLTIAITALNRLPDGTEKSELITEYTASLKNFERLQNIYEVAVEIDKDTAGTFIQLPENDRLDLIYRYTMKKILSVEPLDLARLNRYLRAWYMLKQKTVRERIEKYFPDLDPIEYAETEHAMMQEGYQN